ncbi:hypothetical protein [Arthrobacter sp. NicSoilB8]|uniref:hypothetical protein n=1 Tax=Arthrobacter sp. NicSoilB8 TaxID=2830998 RepID=UPI001CC3FE0D|nr:hypothetical protein [Arthrobacter sp. NicSoilB8]BCW72444.1 hypothetical protein NicSoilB8_34880 [Arthrobacter sp. NicSoilB8]
MVLTTTGLTGGGVTPHYRFQYEDSLRSTATNPTGLEPARMNAVIAVAEADYDQLSGWFGNIALDVDVPITVSVTPNDGGAGWGFSGKSSIAVTVNPATGDSTLVRYLLISEMSEQLMRAQGFGWFGDNTEGSQGEGLSRFLAAEFLARNSLGGTPAGFPISDLWLASDRADNVNIIVKGDSKPTAASGCSILFIYYLYSQLGFTIEEIIRAGGDNLQKVYSKLTNDDVNPFPDFKQVLDDAFPPAKFTAIGGSNPDNPFPLPSPRLLSMSRNIATFPNPDAYTAKQVLSMNGKHSLRPALNTRRRSSLA